MESLDSMIIQKKKKIEAVVKILSQRKYKAQMAFEATKLSMNSFRE